MDSSVQKVRDAGGLEPDDEHLVEINTAVQSSVCEFHGVELCRLSRLKRHQLSDRIFTQHVPFGNCICYLNLAFGLIAAADGLCIGARQHEDEGQRRE